MAIQFLMYNLEHVYSSCDCVWLCVWLYAARWSDKLGISHCILYNAGYFQCRTGSHQTTSCYPKAGMWKVEKELWWTSSKEFQQGQFRTRKTWSGFTSKLSNLIVWSKTCIEVFLGNFWCRTHDCKATNWCTSAEMWTVQTKL